MLDDGRIVGLIKLFLSNSAIDENKVWTDYWLFKYKLVNNMLDKNISE